MFAGQISLIEARGTSSLEDAFIKYMEDAIASASAANEDKSKPSQVEAPAVEPAASTMPSKQYAGRFSIGRMLAYTNNEAMQIRRDPVRLAFAFIGSALLMLVFGFGITTDVEDIRYAWTDLDQSPESREYLEQFAASYPYFTGIGAFMSSEEALKSLQADQVSLVLEIGPGFGRDVERGSPADISAQADGANTYVPRRNGFAVYAGCSQSRNGKPRPYQTQYRS